jgi:hypothetical protein
LAKGLETRIHQPALAAGHGNNFGFHNQKFDSDVSLWNTLTGQRLHTFKGHANQVACVAFSPDGKRLASGSADHTILLWDVVSLPQLQPAAQKATAKQLEDWWQDLGGEASIAHLSLAQLITHPQQAIEGIQGRLKPAPAVDTMRIAALIKDLDSPRYSDRQQATTALEAFGELAEPALRRGLGGKPSLECRRRLEVLLGKVESAVPSPAQLRVLRAAAVLEWIGTAQARQLLQALAKGAPETRQTQEARAALDRLTKRPKSD